MELQPILLRAEALFYKFQRKLLYFDSKLQMVETGSQEAGDIDLTAAKETHGILFTLLHAP